MRTTFLAAVLLSLTLLAPLSHAQRDYGSPLHFTVLGADGPNLNTYLIADSVAIDGSGTVYVGDLSRSAIRKISSDGTVTTRNTFFVTAEGERAPVKLGYDFTSMAVDAATNVYVAHGRSVYKITPDGTTTTLAGDFFQPHGIAVDGSGNVYVADTENHAIRKISSAGIVSTFAGKVGERGSSDGTGSARFFRPTGVAVDSSGTVFVADYGNETIRKITPDGVVATLAGLAGRRGGENGIGPVARFSSPHGIAVDRFGALYIAEVGYQIRRITPDGATSTIGILGGFDGRVEGGFLSAIAVDRDGTIFVTDGWFGAVLASPTPPNFSTHLAGQSVRPGGTATFFATATGFAPITYQWLKDGAPIAGATANSLTISGVQSADLGNYTLVATSEMGSSTSNPAALTFLSAANRLTNLAIRSNVGPGPQSLIVGFVVNGTGATTGSMALLIRGVGPALGAFGVPDFLVDPTLSIFSGTTLVASNDNWNGDPLVSAVGAQVGAFPFASTTSRDAALYRPGLGAGAYSAQIAGAGGSTGVALAEIYDATASSVSGGSAPRLVNVSARASVGTGADILIAGFTVGGTTAQTLLVRAIGPSLGVFGVTGVLADPKLELFQGMSLIQSNDNWGGDALVASAAVKAGAFALEAASRDAALLVTLPPGSYTARVSGVANTTGVALIEIYIVQ